MAANTNTNISKEMQDAIDNYADSIRTLKDFQTAVRTRQGMYLGALNNEGMLNMTREIFQNAVDQMMLSTSPCDHFNLFYNEQTLEVICEDNGLGIPFDDIVRIMTTPHTSKNFDKRPYEYSSGLNGIGAKVVNALSISFIVESYRYDGTAAKVEFKCGYPTTKKYVTIPNKQKIQGTRITFIPDLEVMGNINLEWKRMYRLIKNIMCQTNIGNYMNFEAIDINGKKFTEKIVNTDGILSVLYHKVKAPIIKPISIFEDDGFRRLNCAFCYDAGDENGPASIEDVTAFSNFCPTSEGTHIDGVVDGICRWFVAYMNNIYLVNQKAKDKIKVNSSDIKNGLNIMISAAHLEPEFTGQAKERLSNEDMFGFCKDVVMKGLDQWSKDNPQDLTKISKFFKDIAEIRQKGEKEKTKIVAKYDTNVLSGLPKKYKRPLSKKHNELIIVEGDSAASSSTTARDANIQGKIYAPYCSNTVCVNF
jgi:topoisomerase-4 subunit B